jgi:parvulin-like peptidyl-prolyl isomerase
MISLSKASIQPEEIEHFLKKNIRLKEIHQEILCQIIVTRAAQERGLTVTPQEIQAEADRMRREMRLEKASDTLAWLADQMMAAEDWEEGIRDRILAKKLSEALFASDVKKYFAEHRLDFEQVLLYQIIVPYERVAQELLYQIEEEEINFYEAAHLYDIDERRRHQCGYEGKILRWSLTPDIASFIFNAEPRQILGPMKTQQGYHLFRVEEVFEPELTPEIYQEILKSMFDKWLESELNYMLHNLELFFVNPNTIATEPHNPNKIMEKRLEDSGIVAI